MKKFLLITFISAAIGTAFISCDNGAYSATPDGGGGGTTNGNCVCKDPMSARIGSTEWVAASATATSSTTPLGNSLIISGSTSSYAVMLTVSNYTGTKDYTCGGIDASISVTDIANSSKSYVSVSGTIKFTDDVTKYVGTFSGSLKNPQDGTTLSIGGGYFNVTK